MSEIPGEERGTQQKTGEKRRCLRSETVKDRKDRTAEVFSSPAQ